MPLWQIFHPVDAYSAEDKKKFAERITDLYAQAPIPRFYVVTLFQPIPADSYFVGGLSHPKFVRVKIDQMARTVPGPVLREWWMRRVEEVVAPYVRDRSFDWEIQIDEVPADLWTLQGVIPPPFESIAEKRWIDENKASPYSPDEKIPVNFSFAPGATEKTAD
jgi:phenylpyruvate tautomerase PptA (4-oxalocrotonate tautomerase family)